MSPDAGKRYAPLADRMRPRRLEDIVGQDAAVGRQSFLYRMIERDTIPSHLLFGPPGCGKTTIASVIAEMTKSCFIKVNATSSGIKEIRDVVSKAKEELSYYQRRTIVFIDEIHRLSPVVEEILYPALEDFQIDIMIGEGPAARSIKLDLPPFTLIGATTRAGALTNPLRARFGIVSQLQFYDATDLQKIVERSSGLLNVPITPEGAAEIACRSRGTPRIANRLLRRVRDYAQVRHDGKITQEVASAALKMLDVDPIGLDTIDRRFMLAIIEKFAGGPVGIDNLASAVGEDRETLEDVVEPYLIQQGLVQRTVRGRMATALAYRHFGLAAPSTHPAAADLFGDLV